MKKRGIGKVTRGSGFSQLVREVEAGELITITRGNKSVAIVMPATDAVVQYFEQVEGLMGSIQEFVERGQSEELGKFLILNAMLGDASKSLLFMSGFDVTMYNAMQTNMMDNFAKSYMKERQENLSEESGSAGEQPPAPIEEGVKGEEQSSPTSKKRKKMTPS